MDPDLKLIETSRYQITPLARWLLFISFGLLWIFKLNTWVFFFICHKHRLDGYWLGTSFHSKSVSTNSSFPIKVKAWYFQAHYSYKVSVIRERWSTEKRGRNHFEIANHLFLLPGPHFHASVPSLNYCCCFPPTWCSQHFQRHCWNWKLLQKQQVYFMC